MHNRWQRPHSAPPTIPVHLSAGEGIFEPCIYSSSNKIHLHCRQKIKILTKKHKLNIYMFIVLDEGSTAVVHPAQAHVRQVL